MLKSVSDALDSGIDAESISESLSKGMETIASRFDKGEIYLPHILAASKVVQAAMDTLSSKIPASTTKHQGIIVMGTVAGDMHEIGKNICIVMLRGAGYDVIDLGSDVSPEEFVDAVKKYSPEVVGGSALMTTTLDMQRVIVDIMKKNNCKPLLFFGGAPCTKEWVDSIKGDGYSSSGYDMVLLVNRMLKNQDGTVQS